MTFQLQKLACVAALAMCAEAGKYGSGVSMREKREFVKAMEAARPDVSASQTLSRKIVNKALSSSGNLREEVAGRGRRRRLDQGADDAVDEAADDAVEEQANNKWYYNRDGVDDAFHGDLDNPFGFDATQYSIKYARCAEVQQYSDELAATEDAETVLETKHFAVFRFCPAKTCVDLENDAAACDSNYGEYMLELYEFLAIMQEHREAKFELYCVYCEECMQLEYQMWLKNNGRELSDESRALFEAQAADRQLGGHACAEYDECKVYENRCGGGDYLDDMAFDASGYFECTEVETNSGKIVYIGPHCSADGETIVLGVYSDEYCAQYIGNSVDIEHILGEEMTNETLREYYDPEDEPCIPCNAADQIYYGDPGFDDQADDYEEVNELCYELYQYAARCDQHFRSYNRQKYSYYNVDEMKLSCDFIDSIVMGNYDEYGNVRLTNDPNEPDDWYKDNIYYQEYEYYASEVTPGQIVGLAVSALASAILGVWACTLHRSLNKKEPWKPKRGLAASGAGSSSSVSRNNSGIVMGRSVSGASYYMT